MSDEKRDHWYAFDVNARGETLLSGKVEARSSGEAAGKARERFETSMNVMDLPTEYEIVTSRRFKVKAQRVRRDLEMKDET